MNSSIHLYKTGDYESPEEAHKNGALYTAACDITPDNIGTATGLDFMDACEIVRATAQMLGYSESEYEIILSDDSGYITANEAIEKYYE